MQKEQNTSNSGRFTAFASAPPLTARGRKVNFKNLLAIVLKAIAVVPFFDRVSFANNCTSHLWEKGKYMLTKELKQKERSGVSSPTLRKGYPHRQLDDMLIFQASHNLGNGELLGPFLVNSTKSKRNHK
jgi:hypothetical protein